MTAFKKGDVVEIREGWDGKGRKGVVVGSVAEGRDRDDWTPILWDGDDDPTFFKGEGLELFVRKPFVISILFILDRDGRIYAEKRLDNGAVVQDKIGQTPAAICGWMRMLAEDDGVDLNEALRKAFGRDADG
jgi:hypothetical protein